MVNLKTCERCGCTFLGVAWMAWRVNGYCSHRHQSDAEEEAAKLEEALENEISALHFQLISIH